MWSISHCRSGLLAIFWVGAFALCACSTGVNRRSSDCKATVNRCVDRCAGQAEALSPRNSAIDSEGRAQVAPSSCERNCYRDCR